MPSRLQRYLSGAHEAVWEELTSLGLAIYEPVQLAEAEAIAHETMGRARRNVEMLMEELPSIGWSFKFPKQGPPTDYCVHAPPRADVAARISDLERLTGGPLPLSIKAWWEVVGTVCFMRRPPERFEEPLPDPLVVDPVESVIAEFEDWNADPERRSIEPRFLAPFAPDELHKDDISGGEPYVIELPSPGADAMLLNEWHHTTFVPYLRNAFRCAGLPGWCRDHTKVSRIEKVAARLLPL